MIRVLLVGEAEFQKDIAKLLQRLYVGLETASDEREARDKLRFMDADVVVIDYDSVFSANAKDRYEFISLLAKSGRRFIVVSSLKEPSVILEAVRCGASDYILKPYNQREFILRFLAVGQKKLRLACIGGGTGLFTLLLGLKNLPNILLTSIVNMSDDGGSSGKLSQSFGILPPGDVRRSLVALSNAPDLMNQIMQHRFEKGEELKGHSFGNIFLTVLAEVKGSMSEAVRALSDILNIQGIVVPATRTSIKLAARFEDGTVIEGESRIDVGTGRNPDLHISELWHQPAAECDPEAYSAILNADIVTIGPGDLYTSVITNLAIGDLREAVVQSRAKKIYICNLMTKPGETAGFRAVDHVREIIKYLGGDYLDAVLISNTPLSSESILDYSKKGQSPVTAENLEEIRKITKAEIITADIGNQTELVRHDPIKLEAQIQKVLMGLSRGSRL